MLPVLVSLVLLSTGSFAQQTGTVTSNQLRLDLRKLGHPPLDVIPPGESAVTSLVIGADGCLYGGTSGERAHLFVLDPKLGYVFPLGHLQGEESIYHSLAATSDLSIYIGTSLYNRGRTDLRGKDVLSRYKDYAGGHLYRFFAQKERRGRKRMQIGDPQRSLPEIEDLGIVVPGEGIVCLISGEEELYGVTFPGGHFFVTDLASQKTTDLGPICGLPLNEEPFRSIPRALVRDLEGRVWGAGDYGDLFHYDPHSKKIIRHTNLRLPSELGREFKTVLDALVIDTQGIMYGGTSDGYLFRFDPEAETITNLGKPVWQYRIRGLALSHEGDLWGLGGERGGAVRLFVYRRAQGGFENLGLLDVNRSPYYAWLAYESEAMVTGRDGTIFIGEANRISHLFVLYPWR